MSILNLNFPNQQNLFAEELTLSGNLNVANINTDDIITSDNITTDSLNANNAIISSQITANTVATANATVNGLLTVADTDSLGTFTASDIIATNATIDSLTLTFSTWAAIPVANTNVLTFNIVSARYYDYGEIVECEMSGQIQANSIAQTIQYVNLPVLPNLNFPGELNLIGKGIVYNFGANTIDTAAVFARIGTKDFGIFYNPSTTNIDNFVITFSYRKNL